MTANAQFKEIGPAPFPESVARQKIRTLLERVDPSNRQETVKTLIGWVDWYRDLLDEELIAAWQKDTRGNLTIVMGSLADPRVAAAVVEFSWRQRPETAFIPAYAPMLGDLMERFADSAQPFLSDLLGATGQPAPVLSQSEAETVCRILIDMPDLRTWRKDALQILPHYRLAAENVLTQDLNGADREKSYSARVWLRDLKSDVRDVASEPPTQRRKLQLSMPSGPAPAPAPAPASAPYDGPMSGTLKCSGSPVPQNAEMVFPNLPLLRLQLDYDAKIWEARLVPGEGQTQRLILRNKGAGAQKRCVVHWNVISQSP